MELKQGLNLISEQLMLLDLSNPADRGEFLVWLNALQERMEKQDPSISDRIKRLVRELEVNPALWTNPKQIADFLASDSLMKGVTEFAGEFCEKYLVDLEELSNWFSTKLMDEAVSIEDVITKLKRFVHTLKGDAGSVGFAQLEKSSHRFEELLGEKVDLDFISDQAFKFISYCLNVLDTWKNNNQYLDIIWAPEDRRDSKDASSENQQTIDLSVYGPDANIELLKELLRDPEYSDLVRKDYEKMAELARKTESALRTNLQSSGSSASKSPQVANSAQEKFAETEPRAREKFLLDGDPELYSEFVSEAEDHLTTIEKIVVEDPESEIDLIFRSVHSLKGASGFFKFEELQDISHILEYLLDEVRSAKRHFCDNLKACLASYVDVARNLLTKGKNFWKNREPLTWDELSLQLLYNLEALRSNNRRPASTSAIIEGTNKKSDGETKKIDSEKPFVKVDTVRLDHLIDSIGEMCIYTNMLVRHARMLLKENIEVLDVTHQVEKFARELQSVGIALRLVPIKGLFQKMARLVWDLGKKTGKQIKFEMKGDDTELDRNIIEKLTDPLLHMVRNCVDHGIEPPEERISKGKPREGKISLEATHKGGTIQVILQDDGRGLDTEKILAKAIERGIVSRDQKLSKEEIFSLIFMPGFSTAEKVTDLSGRGVGMDVVKRNVADLRGRILIDSEINRGTKFIIELPLTLAILDGILFRIDHEVYLAPTLSVVEIVDPKNDIFLTAERGLTFNFRGQYLPLYDASFIFGLKSDHAANANEWSNKKVLILETGTERFALLVDEVLESFTTVIKSIDPFVGVRKGISGCSVMSDGSISLIVDIRETLDLAREKTRGIFYAR
ncbi:MAG: chemotaxis protein CheA [Deltaproteobacteria bacterium]|nr:chemotaxis protein CheA [Deltaproteobacteria bacterium]